MATRTHHTIQNLTISQGNSDEIPFHTMGLGKKKTTFKSRIPKISKAMVKQEPSDTDVFVLWTEFWQHDQPHERL